MCEGINCPVKEKCKRFISKSNPNMQSYFTNPPYEIVDGEFVCEMYWGLNQTSILDMLIKITKNKK